MDQDQPSDQDPLDHLSSVTQGHENHEDVAALHSELRQENPNHDKISEIVERLSGDSDLGAQVNLWWNTPQTQAFLAELNAMGL